MNEQDAREIKILLNKTTNGLYESLVNYTKEYQSTLFARSDKIQLGKEIFQRLAPRLKKKVCVEWEYCNKIHDSEYQVKINLIASIADLIVGICGTIPPFNIAVLLVKLNLSKFCDCNKVDE